MARPSPTTAFQERLYAALGPVTDQDEKNGWALLNYCGAIASMYDQIETYARDGELGEPGWSILLDTNRVPVEAVAWLGLITGTQLVVSQRPGETDAAYLTRLRNVVHDAAGQKRGTIQSITRTVQNLLTGTQTVLFRERDTSPYHLTVITYTSETPDQAAVLAALKLVKPAGLILDYQVQPGPTYSIIRTIYTDYTAVRTNFATYQGVLNNQPGT